MRKTQTQTQTVTEAIFYRTRMHLKSTKFMIYN